MSEAKWAKKQPKHGETVLHCGHPEVKGHHFYHMPETHFRRPDGTIGCSCWMALCDSCFAKHADNPESVIRADHKWIGNDPAIKEDFQ